MITVEQDKKGRVREAGKNSDFALKLLKEWNRLRLPVGKQNVVVAVSGGADSTALLLALEELTRYERLSAKVTIAHLDHGLRGQHGNADALWVRDLGRSMGLTVMLDEINVRELAIDRCDNLEQAARRARYEFLLDVAGQTNASIVLTAHTMDDQAETVLLRLMRGSGVDGLGGMKPVRVLDKEKDVMLARPLLRWVHRGDTEDYCHERGIAFRVDQMNEDESFARVRVRKQLLPLMKTFNGRIVDALSRTAQLLQKDSNALHTQAQDLLLEASVRDRAGTNALNVDVLAKAQSSLRRRVLRQWITELRGDVRRLELVHLFAVEKLIFGERGGRIAELPGGACVERSRKLLLFHPNKE